MVFGGITPVSGATRLALSRFRWEEKGGYGLVQNFRELLHDSAFDYRLLVALGGASICLLVVWWVARRTRSRGDWLLLAFLVGVLSLMVGHLAKFVQSVLTTHPSLAGYGWYFVPVYLMQGLAVPVTCWVAMYFTRRFLASRSPPAAKALSVGIVLVGAVFLLAATDFTEQFRRVDYQSEATDRNWQTDSYIGTLVMNRLLPKDCVVGSWDAGVIGYFSDCQVVNLDGLVNSYDYYHETDIGRYGYPRWGERFIPLYREFGLTHFANVDWSRRRGYGGAMLFDGLQLADEGDFYVWPAEPLETGEAAALFWERMEPHFDHRNDYVAVVGDGRVALAFTPGCVPGEQVVWDWVETENEPLAADLLRTENGWCVGVVVSPDGSAQSLSTGPPSRVVIPSPFNVYLTGDRLIYVREPCEPADVGPQFFLHLDPADVNDLPGHRRPHGFDALGFGFADYGSKTGATCLIDLDLPGYPITAIRTGQFVWDGDRYHHLWEVKIRLGGP